MTDLKQYELMTFGEWLDVHQLTLEGGRTSSAHLKPGPNRRWYVTISEMRGVRDGLAGSLNESATRCAGQGFTFPEAILGLYCILAGRVIVTYAGCDSVGNAKPDKELVVPTGLEATA